MSAFLYCFYIVWGKQDGALVILTKQALVKKSVPVIFRS